MSRSTRMKPVSVPRWPAISTTRPNFARCPAGVVSVSTPVAVM
jgi:hypothetical protein